MRIPGRAQLLRFFRAALCVGTVAAVLPSAMWLGAPAHAAVTRSAGRAIIVHRGDTLSGIAARYGISEADLRRWNGIRGSDIRIGQRLVVSEPHAAAASSRASTSPAATRSASRVSTRVYRVRPGDTLGAIAGRYGVSIEDLRRWNGLRGSIVRVGEVLRVGAPGAASESSTAAASQSARTTAPSAAPSARSLTYRVRPGDTLGAIAGRYGVSVEDLRLWNGIRGSVVRVGQVLRIGASGSASQPSAAAAPQPARTTAPTTSPSVRSLTYRVRPGDTLGAIAGRYGVSVEDLRRWNGIRGSFVRVGQILHIGGPTGSGVATAPEAGREPTARLVRSHRYRLIYRVRRGDTLSAIARRYNVSMEDLRRWNGLRGYELRIGQRLRVYTTEQVVYRHRQLTEQELARSRRLQRAFAASSRLRPMAQQLVATRSPAAYRGVTAYARSHSDDAAAAAYLALGHAYLLDHRYTDAIAEFRRADRAGSVLDDFAAYLMAQAYIGNDDFVSAESILSTFTSKFPDSIFVPRIPIDEANVYIQQKNASAALAVLNAHQSDPIANHADFQFALAEANQLAGNTAAAERSFTRVYLDFPLSSEATKARAQLASMGVLDSMPASERRRRADALFHAGRYTDAEIEYDSLARNPSFSSSEREAMRVASAACRWKLHRLTLRQLENLPNTNNDAGARRLQLMMELARDRGDTSAQQALVIELAERFPTSPWLAQALFSSGNMYLLRDNYPMAVRYYSELAEQFPHSSMAPLAHWHAAWLTYRLGNYTKAAKLMDQQIALYPDSPEAATAIYWRARIYDGPGHNPGMAVKYYRKVASVYCHYYFAGLARKRLIAMGFAVPSPQTGTIADPPSDPPAVTSTADPNLLEAIQPELIPDLTDDVPEQDPHLVAARLLANAGLNEYIGPEIHAAEGSDQWGSLAEAEIYASYGETWRALHFMKQAVPFYTVAPIDALPMAYWKILFPTPYWSLIKRYAAANNLDPYMVASLIRQESEFNPGAVSYAHAYGLMQLLPSVGRDMARQLGMGWISDRDLLDPAINIRLGCRYLREMLDATGDKPEYAFAAYNAGANRVAQWKSQGPYNGMDDFVTSIPFTQTRNYVQAIVRNEAMYRELAKVEAQQANGQ